jgi:4a-hydroxytetrahydrobiopterin dehydratase
MSLTTQHCIDGAPALDEASITALLPQIPDWSATGATLRRSFAFKDWGEGLAFANAVSGMVAQQNHHPVLTLSYRTCELAFTTHSAGHQISLNDFICAARADAIYAGQAHG